MFALLNIYGVQLQFCFIQAKRLQEIRLIHLSQTNTTPNALQRCLEEGKFTFFFSNMKNECITV